MSRDKTSSNPSTHVPSTEDELAPRGTEQGVDRIDGPIDADWPDRERAAQGHPPPDDGDIDASPYGYGDPDEVRDEGVLESLGKAVSSPVRDEADERLPQDNQGPRNQR